MPLQPLIDLRLFMSSVTVGYNGDVEIGRALLIDLFEKASHS
jgi:hypothetical protein